MESQSPWIGMVMGAVVIVGSLWTVHGSYPPSDSTPLQVVDDTAASVATKWIATGRRGTGPARPIVTIAVADGRAFQFTAQSDGQAAAAQSLMGLSPGTPIHAQVDSTGEIWEVRAAGQEIIPLEDTLAQHHRQARFDNPVVGFFLALGLGGFVAGFRQLRAGA